MWVKTNAEKVKFWFKKETINFRIGDSHQTNYLKQSYNNLLKTRTLKI